MENNFVKPVISLLLTEPENHVPHAFQFLFARHVARRSNWQQN
jgi:hypothetical protein